MVALMKVRSVKNLKRIKQHKLWKIYLNKEGEYLLYLPDTSPSTADPDWEAGSLQEALDFINSY